MTSLPQIPHDSQGKFPKLLFFALNQDYLGLFLFVPAAPKLVNCRLRVSRAPHLEYALAGTEIVPFYGREVLCILAHAEFAAYHYKYYLFPSS